MTMPKNNSGMPAVNRPSENEAIATISSPEASVKNLVPGKFDRQTAVVELAPPSVLTAPPTPMGLLLALRRRWFLALMLGLLGGVVGTLVAWNVFPVTWRARTVLHISANLPFIIFDTPDARTDFGNYQRSQLVLAKSRLVLNAALRNPEVAALPLIRDKVDPIEWLEKKILVDFAAGPEIMIISMLGDRPEEMSKIVNAVREAYLKEIVNKEQNTRLKRLDMLQKLYEKFDKNLRDKSKEAQSLAKELGHNKHKGETN